MTKTWYLDPDGPGAYTIAADARCGPTDYYNDHIWELSLEGGDPPSLSLQTTFGLRARNLRLFPRFVEGDTGISNPEDFNKPPVVHKFYPNYLQLSFSPSTGIEVQSEYWVPESHAVAGRVKIKNSRLAERHLRFEWTAMLSAIAEGQCMTPAEMDAATVLQGQTEQLAPVIFMTGGPYFSPGPYPALAIDLELLAGSERTFTWTAATLEDHQASFEKGRQIAAREWDGEISRLDIQNDGLIQIETGNPCWDAAFALAQKNAFGLLVGPTDELPHPSFVFSRQPDQGYSARGDGSDYTHLWAGQSALETNFLVDFLLPCDPELAQGLLENFLSTQQNDGFVDWKPGLGGQRSGLMVAPILAHTAWKVYQVSQDDRFLEENYPKLLNALQHWFTSKQDRDGDGIPEWTHLIQAGLDAHPTFSQWESWSQGADISQSESPALCALLYNEIQTLMKIARILERTESAPALQALAENLLSGLDASWDEGTSLYRYWDRASHFSPAGEMLGLRKGPGEIYLQRTFDQPARLVVTLQGAEETPRQAAVFFHGTNLAGKDRIERIDETQLQWRMQTSHVTSQYVYASLEYVDIQNIKPDDHVQVEVIDLACQDYSLFLPLWAGIPSQERADAIIRNALLNPERFWRPYGIPLCPPSESERADSPCPHTSILWESLIGAGLIAYGYRQEAATLVTRIMNAIIPQLSKHKAFARNYQTETGACAGEYNALQGLAPLPLFMRTLGVEIISPAKIGLEGENPFDDPVTIHYRGTKIIREKAKTQVIFPDGQKMIVKGPKPYLVELDRQLPQ